MEPNAPERRDGVPAAGRVAIRREVTAADWEVVDGAAPSAPSTDRGRFYRYVWRPYRVWLVVLVIGFAGIGTGLGWLFERNPGDFDGEGATVAGPIVGVFL